MTVRLKKLYVDCATELWFALLLLIAVAIVLYARDAPTCSAKARRSATSASRTASARSQMAWWFFLTLISFVYIWLVTGDRDSIPPSLLGLMGISAATAFAAAVVTRGEDATAKRARIDSAIADIDTSLAAIAAEKAVASTAVLTALTAKEAELQKTRDALTLQKVAISPIVKSSGWWRDLVTDDRGSVALDRLQVVVWTIVLGGIFLESVVWELTMPEFNATLLTLMGISSGTYIGFKLPGASSTDKP